MVNGSLYLAGPGGSGLGSRVMPELLNIRWGSSLAADTSARGNAEPLWVTAIVRGDKGFG